MRSATAARAARVASAATALAPQRRAPAFQPQQRRQIWLPAFLRRKRPSAVAAAADGDPPSPASAVVLPGSPLSSSGGRALAALGPGRDRHDRLGFGFSAGGLLFPYFLGVACALRESGALVPGVTPLAGASAGSLIAACVGCGMDREEVEAACLALAEDCRTGGTFGRLGHVLRDFLEEHLPPDAHDLARGKVHVAVTPLAAAEVASEVKPSSEARVSSEKLLSSIADAFSFKPTSSPLLLSNPFALSPRALLVSDFTSREDLIEALLSSCHIPFWMTGRPTTRFRGGRAVDGGLLNFLPLPPPPGEAEDGDGASCYHSVGVCCFPSAGTIGARLGPGRLIAPDVFPAALGSYDSLSSSSSSSSSSFDEADLARRQQRKPTFPTLLQWAFTPADEGDLKALAALGEADARAWAAVELAGSEEREREAEERKGEALASMSRGGAKDVAKATREAAKAATSSTPPPGF